MNMQDIPGTSQRFARGPDHPLPSRSQVVVIGGGVVGISAALTLARRGIPVTLLEKGRIAGEQSSRNWGWIRNQGRDLREIPLMLESQNLWRRYGAELRDIGLREEGVTYLALTEEEMARHEAWFHASRPFQLTTRLLSPSEAGAYAGRDAEGFYGGILTPTDMHAEPALAVPALAHLASDAGAQIFEGTAVRTIEYSGGHLTGVVTEDGLITCDAVILAGGAWSRTFLENMGLGLPQLAVRSQAIRTAPVEVPAAGPVGTPRAAIRPRKDGGVTVGRAHAGRFDVIPAAFTHFRAFLPHLLNHWPELKVGISAEFFGPLGRRRWSADGKSPFEAVRVLDPTPDARIIRKIKSEAAEVFPQLRDVPVVEAWGGMIDVMPDEIPVIGPITGADGLILATGLSGHGFGLGPGVGHLAADLATGADPIVNPATFAPDRFRRS